MTEDLLRSKGVSDPDRAMEYARLYAQIEGDHHRLWVIDQMARCLLGDGYEQFVKDYENNGEFQWDVGSPP